MGNVLKVLLSVSILLFISASKLNAQTSEFVGGNVMLLTIEDEETTNISKFGTLPHIVINENKLRYTIEFLQGGKQYQKVDFSYQYSDLNGNYYFDQYDYIYDLTDQLKTKNKLLICLTDNDTAKDNYECLLFKDLTRTQK